MRNEHKNNDYKVEVLIYFLHISLSTTISQLTKRLHLYKALS